MSANTKTKYGGQNKYLPDELVEINLALERIMKWAKYSLTITQGSWSGSVSASAGTHNAADGQDLTPNSEKAKEKYLRILGCMYYIRPAIAGVWPRHGHGGRDYSTGGSRGYKQQLVQYHARRNALANAGPDMGYRMLVFPRHIYKGYIGYVEARTNCRAFEQQTKKSKVLTHCKKGQITYVVAETEVGGSRWYVTLTGKCIKASEWKKIAKPAGATPERPNPPKASKPTPTVPKAEPTPAVPTAPVYKRLNVGTRNVIYRRMTPSGTNSPFTNVKKGLSWKERLVLLAKDAADADLCLLATQEAGTYASSQELEVALQSATKKDWSNILHGDNAGDITQGILWRKDIFKLLDEGKVDLEGSDHDWLTWSRVNILGTNTNILFGSVHHMWRGGGKSAKGNQYDHLRERQAGQAMDWMTRNAKENDILILAGDMNSAVQNPYDGPGKAAAARGWTDAEAVADKQIDTAYNSHHDGTPVKSDRQLDRFFLLKKQVTSGKVKVSVYQVDANMETIGGSDHFQAHIEIVVKTN